MFLSFYECKIYFCKSWTSESCMLESIAKINCVENSLYFHKYKLPVLKKLDMTISELLN